MGIQSAHGAPFSHVSRFTRHGLWRLLFFFQYPPRLGFSSWGFVDFEPSEREAACNLDLQTEQF
jgi:hypothetical protein